MSKMNKTKNQFIKSLVDSNNQIDREKDWIKFNYNYFKCGDGSGESFKEWEIEGKLADLNDKLKCYSGKSKIELINDGTLEIYSSYPLDSKFVFPKDIYGKNISWARLRITGRERLIGFFRSDCDVEANVLFIVFLDKDHQFAPSKKKHT